MKIMSEIDETIGLRNMMRLIIKQDSWITSVFPLFEQMVHRLSLQHF